MVNGCVVDVAGSVFFLDSSNAVLQARGPWNCPRPRKGCFVAGVWPERLGAVFLAMVLLGREGH